MQKEKGLEEKRKKQTQVLIVQFQRSSLVLPYVFQVWFLWVLGPGSILNFWLKLNFFPVGLAPLALRGHYKSNWLTKGNGKLQSSGLSFGKTSAH